MQHRSFLLVYRGSEDDPPVTIIRKNAVECADALGFRLCYDVECKAHLPRLGPHVHLGVSAFPPESEQEYQDPERAGQRFRVFTALGGEVYIPWHNFSSLDEPPAIYFQEGKSVL